MPQMAPALWTPLFFVMICTMLLLVTLVYFSESPSPNPIYKKSYSINPMNWLW
nr:TPA_asm: ATP8 [Echinogammarus veneris]